jgi:hypothetical protein
MAGRSLSTSILANLQPFQVADLHDDRRMEQYIESLEHTITAMARALESLQSQSAGISAGGGGTAVVGDSGVASDANTGVSIEQLALIKDALESGGVAELDLTNLPGVTAENVEVRFRIVTSAPDPTSVSYDAYILSSGGSYSLWQIDRGQNPPVAVQIGLTAGHAMLSATHTDTVAAAVVRGDVIIGNSTPAWAKLAVGAANTVLGSNGTDPSWAAVADAALSANVALLNLNPQTFTGEQIFAGTLDISSELEISSVAIIDNTSSPYTVAAGITLVAVNTSGGAVTVKLPATVPLYRVIIVVDVTGNAAANNITIDGNTNNINGAATVVVATNYAGKWIQGTGSDYNIIGTITP